MKNKSAGVMNAVPTSDHLDVPDDNNEHHDEHHKVGNRDPDNTPVITLVINTFSTHELHEIHTWQPAEYTAADLTDECYQETRP